MRSRALFKTSIALALAGVLSFAAHSALAEAGDTPPAAEPVPDSAKPGSAKPSLAPSLAPSPAPSADATPEDRQKTLDGLYDKLGKATDAVSAAAVRADIRQLRLNSGSATIDLLLARDAEAALAHDSGLRRQLLEAAAKLAPSDAEIWSRRAGLDYGDERFGDAMADLANALAIDPRQFDALEALASILKDTGRNALALKAFRRLKAVDPTAPNIDSEIDDLARKVEDQKI